MKDSVKHKTTTADDYVDSTIIEICDWDGIKSVHFMGYGYRRDREDPPYLFTEYTWFISPLESVLKEGFAEYEEQNQEFYKQYIEECDEERCRWIYEHYDNGEMPKFIYEDEINMDTPYGTYILLKREEYE